MSVPTYWLCFSELPPRPVVVTKCSSVTILSLYIFIFLFSWRIFVLESVVYFCARVWCDANFAVVEGLVALLDMCTILCESVQSSLQQNSHALSISLCFYLNLSRVCVCVCVSFGVILPVCFGLRLQLL